ncbi:hypothetical protein MPSEU_000182100 [Mayamaea pseudoterrestris]|nr:hypothetical protein MPSEU_000182100 [Mayamaea pseudoterrestris]
MNRFGRNAREDPRRAMTQRMQAHSVQLRKRRKEERLTARRLLGTTVMNDDIAAAANDGSNAMILAPSLIIRYFLEHPFDLQHFANLQELVASQQGREYLLQMIADNADICKNVVSQLSASLQKPAYQRIVLTILQEIAMMTKNFASLTEDYYGRQPLSWQILMTRDSLLLPSLLSLPTDSGDPQTSLQTAALTTLGMLVQQQSSSSAAIAFCLNHWVDYLLQALPSSSFCCAAVLRQDATTYGMQFFSEPFQNANYLMALFQCQGNDSDDSEQNSRTIVHAAWMLQGLSFREDAVVDFICRDAALFDTVLQAFNHATINDDQQLSVPLLQAFCNLATACHGKYVSLFLSRPDFVESLSRLLYEGRIMDSVPMAGSLLVDYGLEQHPSTTIAGPALLPGLVQALLHVKYDWRAQAVAAIATAFDVSTLQPPDHVPLTLPQSPTPAYNLKIIYAAAEQVLWRTASLRVPILESIATLIRPNDMNATFGALAVLDLLFQCLLESRVLFESVQGPRRLDELCNHYGSGESLGSDLAEAQAIAAHLLDLYFNDSEDEDDNEDNYDGSTKQTAMNSQFTFDLTPVNNFSMQQSFNEPTASAQGRGRGRTLPAWMQ